MPLLIALLRNDHALVLLHRLAFLLLQAAQVHQTTEHTCCVVGIVSLLLSRHLLFSFLRSPRPFRLSPPLTRLLKPIASAAFAFDFAFFLRGIVAHFPPQQAAFVLGMPFCIDAACALWEGPLWPTRGFTSLEDWAAVLWSGCEAAFYTGVVPLQLAHAGAHIDRQATAVVPLMVFLNTLVIHSLQILLHSFVPLQMRALVLHELGQPRHAKPAAPRLSEEREGEESDPRCGAEKELDVIVQEQLDAMCGWAWPVRFALCHADSLHWGVIGVQCIVVCVVGRQLLVTPHWTTLAAVLLVEYGVLALCLLVRRHNVQSLQSAHAARASTDAAQLFHDWVPEHPPEQGARSDG
ncbi:hypothetical protein AB1Y20_016274 [Prymnesium parvum]|uniref:Glycerophosphocholine acyltransferase 1 n=1 Tax=Prymnesium parvum TaxID=97485 RepID=A0AB34ICD1_PRYPA